MNEVNGVHHDVSITPRGLRRILPDTAPWRESHDFRLVWLSGVITSLGSIFAMVALPLQIKDLTGSPFAVGAIGLAGWASRVHRHGRMVLLGSVVLGACMIGVGFTHRLWLVLLLLIVGGAAHVVSDLFRGTIWNQSIPDRLHGRLAGIELLIGASGPQLGDVRAGTIGARFGVRASIWSGGAACVALTGALALLLPALWRYDGRTDPHAAAVRTG